MNGYGRNIFLLCERIINKNNKALYLQIGKFVKNITRSET